MVAITLTVTPPETQTSLSTNPDIEVTFDDPTGVWYFTWAAQPEYGIAFSAVPAGGKTTVRLGNNKVELNAVPIANGETCVVNAHLSLPDHAPQTTIQVQTRLGDGMLLNGMSCSISGPVPPP